MDQLIISITDLDPGIQVAMLTAGLALLAWLIKSFIQDPIDKSRETFMSLMTKRIEVTAQMKNFLAMIALFHEDEEECKKFKENLQSHILASGATGYLDQDMCAEIIAVSVQPGTNLEEVRKLIERANSDISKWSSRAEEETKVYMRYYSPDAPKRIGWIMYLTLRSALVLVVILGPAYFLTLELMAMPLVHAFLTCAVLLLVIWQAARLWRYFKYRYAKSTR